MRRIYSNFILRKCTIKDVDQIYNLQKKIIQELDNKAILRENSQEMFERCIQGENVTLGIYNESALIAVGIMVNERGTEEDLSLDLKTHSVTYSANLKLIMVKKEYRGNGFQRALMWVLEKYAYNKGITHFCTTVSDMNYFSLNNIRDLNYEYDHNAIKYGGLSREVFVKDIRASVSAYNKMIITIVNSIEHEKEPNELVLEGINFDNCFQGDLSIANTGDILEYYDYDSGNTYFGLLLNRFTPMVLIYEPDEGNLQLKEVSSMINSFKLKKVWINTERGI